MRPERSIFSIASLLQPSDKVVVKDMAEWTMTKVVHKGGDCNIANLLICDTQSRLFLLYAAHLLPRQVCRSDRVLESLVHCSREYLKA